MVDSAREYLDGVKERMGNIKDPEVATMFNEFRRVCEELLRRLEALEATDQIVFVPEFLDS